ncbi:hypothetical protein B0H15DRAFT_945970 [Mycena belliarum]|uniref:Uncharacterized protein n=1 Tax=Mycena belliarum TaxID=1033014 RepID=A0AAD6UDH2_9AGAR|nr:hypothetical protein B0H15DRAFT_945970 [Mycena belliae]
MDHRAMGTQCCGAKRELAVFTARASAPGAACGDLARASTSCSVDVDVELTAACCLSLRPCACRLFSFRATISTARLRIHVLAIIVPALPPSPSPATPLTMWQPTAPMPAALDAAFIMVAPVSPCAEHQYGYDTRSRLPLRVETSLEHVLASLLARRIRDRGLPGPHLPVELAPPLAAELPAQVSIVPIDHPDRISLDVELAAQEPKTLFPTLFVHPAALHRVRAAAPCLPLVALVSIACECLSWRHGSRWCCDSIELAVFTARASAFAAARLGVALALLRYQIASHILVS